ncbi:MAG: hypothetical protein JXR03_21155 [Cyclobacteriaceae bacterium]
MFFKKNKKENNEGKSLFEEMVKAVYDDPKIPVDIEFYNRTGKLTNIWIEPSCQSIDLEKGMEYKVVSHDRFFRLEFDEDNQVIFYCQYSFGCKIFKRQSSKDIQNPNEWELEIDLSDIN